VLKIKKIKRYRIAKYPRGTYRRKTDNLAGKLIKGGLTVSILSSLGACGGILAPDFVTENEARSIIKAVFDDNNVNLEEDISYFLKQGETDSIELNLDGYNDSLKVGYEYIYDEDYFTFDDQTVKTLDSLINESGPYIESSPYIKCIDEIDKEENPKYEKYLEETIQEFIDYLKTQGVI